MHDNGPCGPADFDDFEELVNCVRQYLLSSPDYRHHLLGREICGTNQPFVSRYAYLVDGLFPFTHLANAVAWILEDAPLVHREYAQKLLATRK